MLFDLRGRGRRRTVQVIYVSLAVLMGGGLIFFGIGGNTNGGLLDALKNDNSSQSTSDLVAKRLSAAQKRVQARPTDAAAWAELTRVRFQSAEFDQNTGTFTDAGKTALLGAQRAWDKYLTLDKTPDDTVASLMVQAFGPAGLNKPEKAVTAMEIIVDSRAATPQLYVQLAALAYEAGQTRKAELASQKALELAPKDSREQIKAQLDQAKATAPNASSTTTTTTPSG